MNNSRVTLAPGILAAALSSISLARSFMKQLFAYLIIGSLLGSGVIVQTASAATPSFRSTLEDHLLAVSTRNMDALLPTLTNSSELTMIAPDGHKWDTKRQYIDFHRQWFASNDGGKFEFEVVRVVESTALAHALIRYRYNSQDKAGNPQISVNWLALTFALESGSWRLVFDQNTRITGDDTQNKK